jgi:hypothetical protein
MEDRKMFAVKTIVLEVLIVLPQMVLPSEKAFQVTCHAGSIFLNPSRVLESKKIPTE